jgi:hypothetical protein
MFLVQQGSLFKQECISFSEELLETVAAESAHSGGDQVENSNVNIETGINEQVNDEDHWNEMDNTNNEQPGIFDTLFTSPDNGYRILKQLRGSPPYWEAAQKDLMVLQRYL